MTRLKRLVGQIAAWLTGPIANTTIGGGFMAAPIGKFLEAGIKIGLGTDNGGGFSSSILDAIRQAIMVSNARHSMTGEPDLSV